MKYAHEHTSTETLKQLDAMFDEMRENIKNKKIDLDSFKKVYSIYNWYKNNTTILGESHNIQSLEDLGFSYNSSGMELFSTAFYINAKVRISGRKYRVSFSAPAIWYILATTKLLSMESIQAIMNELKDHRFFRNSSIWLALDNSPIYIDKLKKILRLNPNIGDDLRLWIELQ
jgi:hypothetical protein